MGHKNDATLMILIVCLSLIPLTVMAAESKKFTQKIKALENDSEGFFKLGGFMADSSNSADELLEEALTEKYGI